MKREKENKSLLVLHREECTFCGKIRNSTWFKKAYGTELKYFRILYRIFWILFLPIILPAKILQAFLLLLCAISEKIEGFLDVSVDFFRKTALKISLFIMNFCLRNSNTKERISLLDRKLRDHEGLKRKRKYPDN